MSSRVGVRTGNIGIKIGLALSLTSFLFGLRAGSSTSALAQSPETWTELLVLSEPNTYWSRPTIAADPWGQVHVFWCDRDDGVDVDSEGYSTQGDTLIHVLWDRQKWSEPLDIIVKDPHATHLSYPYATAGANGQMYLVWSGGNGLYFSRAPGLGAHDAANWEPVSIVAEGAEVDQSQLVVGAGGRLHAVYAELGGDLEGNLLYTWSEDQGFSWSLPRSISEIGPVETRASAAPQMVADGQGWLHVVWAERAAPDWIGKRILYSRSEDQGKAWTIPQVLGEVQPGELWAEAPSLAITPDGKLHLVWVCGANPHRCFRSSGDGGQTWSSTARILGDFVSLAGWDTLVADHQGNLHFVAQLREPYGIYYATRPFLGTWSEPELIVDQPGFENGHFLEAALSEGNHLHAVWQKSAQEGDVVYIKLTTSTSPVSPLAIPMEVVSPVPARSRHDPTRTPTPASDAGNLNQALVSPTVDDAESVEELGEPEGSRVRALLFGISPAVLLVAVVVVMVLRKV